MLARHGLESLLAEADLRTLLPGIHHAPPGVAHAGPAHLRRALEELGPTFMKLGQVLSTRPDLLPPDYELELSRLQDAAPRVPYHDVVYAIEASLGCSLPDAYAELDPVPLAAASLAQVHAARTVDGAEVVVKVRRPGIVDQVRVDLELLERLARSAARHSAVAARYDVVGLAHEFGATLLDELDYFAEGHNAERLAAELGDDPRLHVPRIFWDQMRADVITEERVRGIKISDIGALDAANIDRCAVARVFADAYLSMVFVHRFFHADPHPGNVFVEASDRIAFVDFGMVGSVSSLAGEGLGTILVALVSNDGARMADGLLRLGIACEDVDRVVLERDLAAFLDRYSRVPLEQLRLGPLLADMLAVVRAHRLHLPSDLALLLKTVMMCEGVAVQLDPSFELVPLLVPYATQITQTPLGETPGSGTGRRDFGPMNSGRPGL